MVTAMDPKKTLGQFLNHIRQQGFYVTEQPANDDVRRAHPKVAYVRQTTGATRAVRVSLDSAFARQVKDTMEKIHGPVIQILTSGGTIPIDAIDDVLATPIITLPIVNHDNNQHSHNENIRLQNLWDGIETMAALMTMDWK
jgi:acetylornithine deacetylase/succinyl-diaminopimelate desuccinylase-like protein